MKIYDLFVCFVISVLTYCDPQYTVVKDHLHLPSYLTPYLTQPSPLFGTNTSSSPGPGLDDQLQNMHSNGLMLGYNTQIQIPRVILKQFVILDKETCGEEGGVECEVQCDGGPGADNTSLLSPSPPGPTHGLNTFLTLPTSHREIFHWKVFLRLISDLSLILRFSKKG